MVRLNRPNMHKRTNRDSRTDVKTSNVQVEIIPTISNTMLSSKSESLRTITENVEDCHPDAMKQRKDVYFKFCRVKLY